MTNPAQASSPRGADSARFVVCRASAGSGKTYTLVRQYLELAFAGREEDMPQRFRRILAITFTNKAAGEMKERILRELAAIAASGTDSPMGKDLAQLTGLDSDALRRRAATVRSSILHGYSDLAVCTIDSFVHRIVHTFAHDLGLPANFNTAVENSDLVQHAVDDLMALAGTEGEEELTAVLSRFAEDRMEEGKGFNPDRALADLAEELFSEETPEYLKTLRGLTPGDFLRIADEYRKANQSYRRQIETFARQGMEAVGGSGVAVEDFYRGKTGVAAFFPKLAKNPFAQPNRYALDFLEGDKLGASKCPPAERGRLEAIKPRLQEIYRSLADFRSREELRYGSRLQLLRDIYPLALLGKMGEVVSAYSKEQEEVHISEFNKRIAEVVQNEPAPFIYERLGSRYHNFLIDEFQDTSRMQWQNLAPLVENGVGGGHTSLVVGDGKQAIYRFRQGDVEQFAALPRVDSPVHGRLLEQLGEVRQLERNFRTARTVVEFNNGFFAWLCREKMGENAELKEIYSDLEQQPVKEGGCVQLTALDKHDWEGPLAEAIISDIRRLTAEEGFRWGDILVVARTKRHLAQIGRHLAEQGIEVVSNESFLLSQSRVVLLTQCVLRLLLDDTDRVAATQAGLLWDSLGAPDCPPDRPLAETDIRRRLPLDRLRALPIYDCCEELLRLTGAGQAETAYTATLLNVVARYSGCHRQDIGEFLEWLDDQLAHDRLSTASPEGLDAVRLMTVHKSKGLEAPVVIYPIVPPHARPPRLWAHIPPEEGLLLPAAKVQRQKDTPSLFDSLYEEEERKVEIDDVNVDYVAMTRPREQLLIYSVGESPVKEYIAGRQNRPGSPDVPGSPACPVWRIGESGSASSAGLPPAAEAAAGERQPLQISYPRWGPRIAIARQADLLFGAEDDSPLRRGNEIHELLSFLAPDTAAGETPAAAALGRYARLHHLDEDEQTALASLLEQVLSSPEAARFFDPQHRSLCECGLVWEGEVLRPDRIVFAGGETWVVDFKTGSPRPEHREQVARYCQAAEALGYPSVQGFLLYLGGDPAAAPSGGGCRVVRCC